MTPHETEEAWNVRLLLHWLSLPAFCCSAPSLNPLRLRLFLSGLFLDIFYGGTLGFYALIYMYTGYSNGFFRKIFYPEDIKLPMILISVSDLACSLLIYFFQFLLRGRFAFRYYLMHIIMPELVYTILVTVFLYFILLQINQKLERAEKRSTGNIAWYNKRINYQLF